MHRTQTTLQQGLPFYKILVFIGIVKVRGLVILDVKLIKVKHQSRRLKDILSLRFAICRGRYPPIRIGSEEPFLFLYIFA